MKYRHEIFSVILITIIATFLTYHFIKCKVLSREIVTLQKIISIESQNEHKLQYELSKLQDLEQLEKYANENGFKKIDQKNCSTIYY